MVVFILKIIDSTKDIGDALGWAFKIVPSYPLSDSIMYSSGKSTL